MVLGKPAKDGESPVDEIRRQRAGSRVPRDTRNLVGSRGDHPPSLNTEKDPGRGVKENLKPCAYKQSKAYGLMAYFL